MDHKSTIAWLKFASGVVIAFGILVSLSIYPVMSGVLNILIDFVLWPLDGEQTINSPEIKFILAVSGGITMGWGILFWQITTKVYPENPKLARTMILTSIWTWFIIDCFGSIMSNAPLNVLLNIPFLLIFLIPLRNTDKRMVESV